MHMYIKIQSGNFIAFLIPQNYLFYVCTLPLMAIPSSNLLQGDWIDDERCGEGELTYNTGEVYHGKWSEDKQSKLSVLIRDLRMSLAFLDTARWLR